MTAAIPLLAVAVIGLAVAALVRRDWEPVLIPVAVLILGIVWGLGSLLK